MRRRAARAQPWRALKRGFFLLITKTRPRRRTTWQFFSRFFAVLSEFTTFMSLLPRDGALSMRPGT